MRSSNHTNKHSSTTKKWVSNKKDKTKKRYDKRNKLELAVKTKSSAPRQLVKPKQLERIVNRLNKSSYQALDLSILEFKKPLLPISATHLEQSEDCDVLHTYSKKKVKCKIKEITENEIKYVPCEDPDGSVVSISRSKVRLISYSDGRIQIVDQTTRDDPSVVKNSTEGEPRTDGETVTEQKVLPLATVALVLSILSLLSVFIGIAGLICGIIALGKIKREPKKYRGKGLAIAAIIIGGLGLLAIIFVLIFLVALLGG